MRRVSSAQFREYLKTFHQVYETKLSEWVATECREGLLRKQCLQNSKILGYVSTTYGIGYEYQPSAAGGLEINFGSRRVEAYFFHHSPKLIEHDGNIWVQLSGRDFKMVGCSGEGRIPLRLDGTEASATLVD